MGINIGGFLRKAASYLLSFDGKITYKGVGIQIPLPESLGQLQAVIQAAEAGFPGQGTGPQKLTFVLPVAFQVMTTLFGKAKGDAAKAAAEKFVSAIVEWQNAVEEGVITKS